MIVGIIMKGVAVHFAVQPPSQYFAADCRPRDRRQYRLAGPSSAN
jgi:hypothetical protein